MQQKKLDSQSKLWYDLVTTTKHRKRDSTNFLRINSFLYSNYNMVNDVNQEEVLLDQNKKEKIGIGEDEKY